jgi:M6 family metalloprotease-like protein
MRKEYRIVACLLMLTTLMTQGMWQAVTAQTGQVQESQYSGRLIQEVHRRFGPDWIVRLSQDGQRVESMLGKGTQPYRGKPADAARQFLRENASLFGLKEDLSDLSVISDKTTPGGGNVELQQTHSGLPVDNAHVQVNLSKEGSVLHVVSSYMLPRNVLASVALDRERAVEIAIAEFLRTTPRTPPPAQPVTEQPQRQPQPMQPISRAELQLAESPKVSEAFFNKDGRLVRVYKVFINARRPSDPKEFIIDANSGEVLKVRGFVYDLTDAHVRVFIPNPVNTMNNRGYRDTGVGTRAVPEATPPYFIRSVPINAPSSGPFTLTGPFARITDIGAPSNALPSEATPDFLYFRNHPNFEDVMAYYHVTRSQGYIQSLGFTDACNRQIELDTDGRFDSFTRGPSHSAGYMDMPVGEGNIEFGRLGVDAAEDADVIMHEYGHAIQLNQARNKYEREGVVTRPLTEGFADYWAVSSFWNETVTSGHNRGCVGEWFEQGMCLRTISDDFFTGTNTPVTLPNFINLRSEAYRNSLIWSRTLWQILQDLGKPTSDRLILQSHYNVPHLPNFVDSADAIMTADLQLYSGSHLERLCQIFIDRGIYSAANCPTLPSTTGSQNTLVVLARFNDARLPETPINASGVTTLIGNINSYLNEVTYGQASLGSPITQGPITLPGSRAHYYDQTNRNMLIELVQDAINLLPPGFDFSPFDRMIVLTNDDGSGDETRGLKEWATTGPWPYDLPSAFGTKRLSVSVHRGDQAADVAQFTHAMGHHFGLIDLYAHEGVTFPRPYADGWGNMAKAPDGNFNNTHFFAWDKLRPGWLTGDTRVRFIPRPGMGIVFDEAPIPIFRQENNTVNTMLIQVGTSNGVTDRAQERVSYYIEARKRAGPFDGQIPSDGVLVYYLNEDIAQGFGPLRLIDATPTDNDVTNAALRPLSDGGPSRLSDIDGTGLNIEVLSREGAEDYRVKITYDPPEEEVDVWINPRDDYWRTPDIWIDSPAIGGFDDPATATDRGDRPVAFNVGIPGTPPANRVYARVYNRGPGIAHDVRVDFWFSDPFHAADGGTIDPDTGGNVAFNKHFFSVIPSIPSGESRPVFVEWTPERLPAGQMNVHSCIKVKVTHVFNDTNESNQAAQENIDEFDISRGSPYPPVVNSVRVVNPYDHPILVYMRADNVPVGWTADIVPRSAFIAPNGSVDTQTTIQAPIDYPVCSTEYIKTSAWYPSGDTLVELGASTAQVNLKQSTKLTLNTTFGECKLNRLVTSFMPQTRRTCNEMVTKGCMNPPRPNERITLQYTGPDGKPIYHDAVTDANGCFEDFFVNPQPGFWNVQAEYPGNDCGSNARSPWRPVFVPPGGGQPGGEFSRRPWLSFHLGMNFPLGSFNTTYDPGPSLAVNAEFPLTKSFSLVGYTGFHYFHGDRDNENFYFTNLSVNARQYFPVSNFRGYVEAGLGIYFPKSGSSKFGMNLGTGFSFPINSNLKFEVGPDIHFVNHGGPTRVFVDARMGIAFKF